MIISFIASVTGVNTLLSKKFHGKSMIGVLKDPVLYSEVRNVDSVS